MESKCSSKISNVCGSVLDEDADFSSYSPSTSEISDSLVSSTNTSLNKLDEEICVPTSSRNSYMAHRKETSVSLHENFYEINMDSELSCDEDKDTLYNDFLHNLSETETHDYDTSCSFNKTVNSEDIPVSRFEEDIESHDLDQNLPQPILSKNIENQDFDHDLSNSDSSEDMDYKDCVATKAQPVNINLESLNSLPTICMPLNTKLADSIEYKENLKVSSSVKELVVIPVPENTNDKHSLLDRNNLEHGQEVENDLNEIVDIQKHNQTVDNTQELNQIKESEEFKQNEIVKNLNNDNLSMKDLHSVTDSSESSQIMDNFKPSQIFDEGKLSETPDITVHEDIDKVMINKTKISQEVKQIPYTEKLFKQKLNQNTETKFNKDLKKDNINNLSLELNQSSVIHNITSEQPEITSALYSKSLNNTLDTKTTDKLSVKIENKNGQTQELNKNLCGPTSNQIANISNSNQITDRSTSYMHITTDAQELDQLTNTQESSKITDKLESSQIEVTTDLNQELNQITTTQEHSNSQINIEKFSTSEMKEDKINFNNITPTSSCNYDMHDYHKVKGKTSNLKINRIISEEFQSPSSSSDIKTLTLKKDVDEHSDILNDYKFVENSSVHSDIIFQEEHRRYSGLLHGDISTAQCFSKPIKETFTSDVHSLYPDIIETHMEVGEYTTVETTEGDESDFHMKSREDRESTNEDSNFVTTSSLYVTSTSEILESDSNLNKEENFVLNPTEENSIACSEDNGANILENLNIYPDSNTDKEKISDENMHYNHDKNSKDFEECYSDSTHLKSEFSKRDEPNDVHLCYNLTTKNSEENSILHEIDKSEIPHLPLLIDENISVNQIKCKEKNKFSPSPNIPIVDNKNSNSSLNCSEKGNLEINIENPKVNNDTIVSISTLENNFENKSTLEKSLIQNLEQYEQMLIDAKEDDSTTNITATNDILSKLDSSLCAIKEKNDSIKINKECDIPVLNINKECDIPVSNINKECDIPVSKINKEWDIPVSIINKECDIPVSKINKECDIPVSKINKECDIPVSKINKECDIPVSKINKECDIPVSIKVEIETNPMEEDSYVPDSVDTIDDFILEETFNWDHYLEKTNSESAPPTAFPHVELSLDTGVKPNQILEVLIEFKKEVNDTEPRWLSFWPAKVVSSCGNLLRLRYVGTTLSNAAKELLDFWCDLSSPKIKPVGWAREHQISMNLPPGFTSDSDLLLNVDSLKDLETVPEEVFSSDKREIYTRIPEGCLLEILDSNQPFEGRIMNVMKNIGGRLLLTDLKSLENKSEWLFFLDSRVKPLGWIKEQGEPYRYKNSPVEDLEELRTKHIQSVNFLSSYSTIPSRHSLEPGMHLEAIFPTTKQNIHSAIVTRVIDDIYFELNIKNHFWITTIDDPLIVPCGFSDDMCLDLVPPVAGVQDLFIWESYLTSTGGKMVAKDLFPQHILASDSGFEEGQKLEIVSPFDRDKICIATIERILQHILLLKLDSNPEYTFFRGASSMDLFPVGWAQSHSYPISVPIWYSRISRNPSFDQSEELMNNSMEQNNVVKSEKSTWTNHNSMWCPRLYINHCCNPGPYLSKNKVAKMSQCVGPGPVPLVLHDVIGMTINSAYIPTRVLRELQHLRKMHSSWQSILLKAKFKRHILKASVNIPSAGRDVTTFLTEFSRILMCCPNLWSYENIGENCQYICNKQNFSVLANGTAAIRGRGGVRCTFRRKKGGKKRLFYPTKSSATNPDENTEEFCDPDEVEEGDDGISESEGESRPSSPAAAEAQRKLKPKRILTSLEITMNDSRGVDVKERSTKRSRGEMETSDVGNRPTEASSPNRKRARVEGEKKEIQNAAIYGLETAVVQSDPLNWSVDDVEKYVLSHSDISHHAVRLREHEIDGRALLLLNLPSLVHHLGLPHPVAVTLAQHICKVKMAHFTHFYPKYEKIGIR